MKLINENTIPELNIKPIRWKSRPLRVLFVSDAPWTTSGYGKQSKFIVPILHRLGVDVAFLTSYGIQGGTWKWIVGENDEIPIYPSGHDAFSNDVIPLVAQHWNADVVITLKDVPVYSVEMMEKAVIRWAPMVPVDHDPIPDLIMKAMQVAWCPIAYAPHGFRSLREAGFHPLYAPHTYDHNVFFPGDRLKARAALGWPADRYIVATVAVNRGGLPSRKAWPQMVEGVGEAIKRNNNLLWYAHTNIAQDGYEGGVNLHQLCHVHGVANHVFFPDQNQYRYFTFGEEFVANIYRAADVLLATSIGEGFGVPILEAQACGVPVIIGNWTAMEDLLFNGISLSKDDAFHYFDQQNAVVYLPKPKSIGDAIIAMAERASQTPLGLANPAVTAAEMYSIDRAAEHWRVVMETMESMIINTEIPLIHRVIAPFQHHTVS
jgi:glycosyltransferase involved in cell wall biosynthesis